MKLYLIRHAESANNAVYGTDNQKAGHTSDPEITDPGHRQGQCLGRHFAMTDNEPRQHPHEKSSEIHYGLTHLYCSLMSRSLLTAQYIAEACGLNMVARPDIFEYQGIYEIDDNGNEVGVEGPGRSYFEKRFPDAHLPEELTEKGWWNRPVESETQFLSRVESSLDDIQALHGHTDHNVAMVVHGDYIDQSINQIMGVERIAENYNNPWVANWVFHNTSISRIGIVNGSRTVVYLNRIDHLPVDLVTW